MILRNFRSFGLLAVAVLLSHAQAKANFVIEYQIDTNSPVTAVNSPSNLGGSSFTGIDGDISFLNLSGGSNSPGSPTIARELTSSLDIANNGTGQHTVTIWITSQDFTSPTAPPALLFSSHIAGTASDPMGDAINFQSFADSGNAAGSAGATGASTPLQTPVILPDLTFKSDSSSTVTTLSSPYSITEKITLTLSAGSDVNFSTRSQLTVPEPGTLIILASGLPLLGFFGARRRRKTTIAA